METNFCKGRWQRQGAGVYDLFIKRSGPNFGNRFSVDCFRDDDIASGSIVSGDGDGDSGVSILEVPENSGMGQTESNQ